MRASSRLVVDASLAVRALVPASAEDGALDWFARAHRDDAMLLAPSLWVAEVASALRKMTFLRKLSPEEADLALPQLFSLGIEIVPPDLALARGALHWAERLGQARAYDGFYLALAEREDALLWTGDGRLADRARQLGLEWLRVLAEPPG